MKLATTPGLCYTRPMLTPESRFRDFPSLRDRTYLNTAAESIPPTCVWEALERYREHKLMGMSGREFHFQELEQCRAVTARLLRRQPEEVAFCSCASEAYNLLASALNLQADDEVIISDLDFPAGATPWLRWPGNPRVRLWKNQQGVLELDDLQTLLNEHTRLVQVSSVSFLTGYRVPWAPFREAVRQFAPQAVVSVDVTQAFGRVALDCLDADCLISSTYKWQLGVHGGGIVAVSKAEAERLTTRAGGWYHLANAFDPDRFERAEPLAGARSFSVGMPPFPALYALRAGLEYLERVGIENIAAHADPLIARIHAGLREAGIRVMSPEQPTHPSGIVSFQHERDAEIQARLLEDNVHVMHQAGRLRVSIHGYNGPEDVERFLSALRAAL